MPPNSCHLKKNIIPAMYYLGKNIPVIKQHLVYYPTNYKFKRTVVNERYNPKSNVYRFQNSTRIAKALAGGPDVCGCSAGTTPYYLRMNMSGGAQCDQCGYEYGNGLNPAITYNYPNVSASNVSYEKGVNSWRGTVTYTSDCISSEQANITVSSTYLCNNFCGD